MYVHREASAAAPSFAAGEVHVWRARLGAPAAAVRQLTGHLCDEERQRAARFRQAGDRARYTLGRGLLRELLASYLGADPRALRFLTGLHGKPRLAAGLPRELEFNVAHSGDFVLVAIAAAPVGVDVECLERKVDVGAIATRFFAPSEVAQLLSAECREHRFLRLWVLKEALLKGLGLGITGLSLRDFAITTATDGGVGIQPLTDDARSLLTGWCLAELDMPGDHAAAIAFDRPGAVARVLDWPGHFQRERTGPA